MGIASLHPSYLLKNVLVASLLTQNHVLNSERFFMICEPHWTTWLSALLTPIVAILGIYIAGQQWKTARNKLKFDLFERRLSVYEAPKNLIGSILTSGKAKNEETTKFLIATREAKWLFNSKLSTYLETDLYKKALDLQTLDAELEGLPVGPDRTNNVKEQSEIKNHFQRQYDVLDKKFSPFLVLQH